MFAIRKRVDAIILLNRRSPRAEESLERLKEEKANAGTHTEISQVICDLEDFESVRKAAEEVNEICSVYGGLNVLANNAGIFWFPDIRTKDGFDIQMQTNHLSHFLLTKLLFPSFDLALSNGEEVRICQHSSRARYIPSTMLDAKYFKQCDKGTLGGNGLKQSFERYHQSKLANVTFALELFARLKAHGYDEELIKSVVADPGIATTAIYGTASKSGGFLRRFLMNLLSKVVRPFIKTQSAADGAVPLIHACFAEEVASGDFFVPEEEKVGRPLKCISKGKLAGGKVKVEDLALDKDNQELCWTNTELACGDFFEFAELK